jgi:hypothetical protein
MSFHQALKEKFSVQRPFEVSYSGGLWGLACNSIHFIDLVAWWSGETLVSVDTGNLDDRWIQSKRPGYYEVTGELIAHYSGGTVLKLGSSHNAPKTQLKVEPADGVFWWVDESGGIATSSDGDKITGQLEYQSTMTPSVVDDILKRGYCGLPAFNESLGMHAIFLDAMLTHWNESQHRNDSCVPIT